MDIIKLGKQCDGSGAHGTAKMAFVQVCARVSGLRPGEPACLNGERPGRGSKGDGIVDPFAKNDSYWGQWFWLMLHPDEVVWDGDEWSSSKVDARPAPKNKTELKAASERFSEAAKKLGISGTEFDSYEDDNPLLLGHFIPASKEVCALWKELEDGFWRDFEILTGTPKPKKPGGFFDKESI